MKKLLLAVAAILCLTASAYAKTNPEMKYYQPLDVAAQPAYPIEIIAPLRWRHRREHYALHEHHYYHHESAHRRHFERSIALPHYASYGGSNAAAARARGLPWCGAEMADLVGMSISEGRPYWVAAHWASWGHATSPHVGAIVVWRHHVGRIVGQQNGEFVVLSGNDGHRVRERARSLRGAIAFRE